MIRDRAYTDETGEEPEQVAVIVVRGDVDVAQVLDTLRRSEHATIRDLARRLGIRIERNRTAAGTEELLAEHGGPDFTDTEETTAP